MRVEFETVLERLRETAFTHGRFVLLQSESINEVVVHERVSKGFGIYVISGCRNSGSEVLYIGMAGTICQDGRTKDQGIRKRLTMKQGGIYRKDYFPRVIDERNLDSLNIEWFETYSVGKGVPPFLAEAELLAAFLRSSGRLPALNKEV